MMRRPMRIVIAEDDDTLRLLLQLQLEDVEDIQIVAAAGTAADAVRITAEHQPDAAVIDVRMPGVEGAQLIAELRHRHPDMGLVAYSSSAGVAVGRELAEMGIPLVLKGEVGMLVDALRTSVDQSAA